MATIKPIETSYGGHRYRSRLEARWAVFLDRAKVAFEYEPEGFQGDGFRYLPDFYLPKLGCYLEVKPENGLDIDSLKKCQWFGAQKRLVLILGSPQSASFFLVDWFGDVDEFILEDQQNYKESGYAARPSVEQIVNSYPWANFCELEWAMNGLDGATTLARVHTGHLNGAMDMAREARFEFGQTPRSPRD